MTHVCQQCQGRGVVLVFVTGTWRPPKSYDHRPTFGGSVWSPGMVKTVACTICHTTGKVRV